MQRGREKETEGEKKVDSTDSLTDSKSKNEKALLTNWEKGKSLMAQIECRKVKSEK